MNSIEKKFDSFLEEVLETNGPEGLVGCLSFLYEAFQIIKDGIIVGANDAFLEVVNFSRSELYGMNALDLVAEEEREIFRQKLAQDKADRIEIKLLKKDREKFDALVLARVFYAGGQRFSIAEVVDISSQKKAIDELKESEEKFHGIFEQAAVGIARVSSTGEFLEVNQKLCDILSYSKAELLNKKFQDITHPEDLEIDQHFVRQMLKNERQTYCMEKRYFDKNGKIIWIRLNVSLVRLADGKPKYFVTIIEDISAIKEVVRELQKRATHDALTGLLNRDQLGKALEKEMQRADRYNRPLSLLMIDIDHFKLVNDNYGHQAGDKVLVELAKILNRTTRKTDAIGRFGGEEFLVGLTELNHEQALILAERIRRKVESNTISYLETQIAITVSIGVSTFPEHGADLKSLIRTSDDAMYKAKRNGRNQVASAF